MHTHTSFRGVALIVLGITAIAFPVVASITAAYVVGWVLIVAGFTHLFLGWDAERDDSMVWAGFISLVYVLAGLAILANPLWGIATIALILGVTLAVDGILSVLMYFTAERTSRWVLVNGLVTVALALVIVSGWLSSSVWMIGTLVGINLLMAGVFELAAWVERERVDHFRVS
jgi:uncharacterized membrane protein HdeD (DUF308 family)